MRLRTCIGLFLVCLTSPVRITLASILPLNDVGTLEIDPPASQPDDLLSILSETSTDGDVENSTQSTSDLPVYKSSVVEAFQNKITKNEDISIVKSIPGSEETKFELENTLRMLNEADERLKSLGNDATNTVLVLGNAGAGKTTFVQLLAGDNSKLFSKEVVGKYAIEDGVKIGSSSTESHTLYPELVLADDTTAYCDTPGFSDTRSPSHEIVATYAMKAFLKTRENTKIVLLVNYHSVEYGAYKDDFINLLRNFNQMIKDIDKYKSNIMMIATKVPNLVKYRNSKYTSISDEDLIKGIAEYIDNVNKSLTERTSKQEDRYQLSFLKNAIQIINGILETDSEGNFRKINIFRMPNEDGPLSNITLMQEARTQLKRSIENNLLYVESETDDWGYTLSDRAILFLEYIVKNINDMIVQLTFSTFNALENFYKTITDENDELHSLIAKIQSKLNQIKTLQRSFNETCNFNEFYSTLIEFIQQDNIQFTLLNNETVSKINQYTERFQGFANVTSILSPATWFVPTRNVEYHLEDTLSWYQYLMDLFKTLSSYSVQKSVRNFNETTFTANALEGKRMEELNNVIAKTVKQPLNITCDSDGKLKLEGLFVKLSEIFEENLIENYCGNHSLKTVIVFALQTVFIDADFVGADFQSVNVEIVAPVWEVIGSRQIILSGKSALPHDPEPAKNGTVHGESGADGLPGLPGENGGHFLGVGMRFINGAGLTVISNGGDGGAGQNGGSGIRGEDGYSQYDRLYDSDIAEKYSTPYTWSTGLNGYITQSMKFNECTNRLEVYEQKGQGGEAGGRGGDGGYGGVGGYRGEILVVELKEYCYIKFLSEQGKSGEAGLGGTGGEGGQKSQDVVCYNVIMKQGDSVEYTCNIGYCKFVNSLNFVNCKRTLSSEKILAEAGPNGISNHNRNGLKGPEIAPKYKPSSDFGKYISFLEDVSNRKLFGSTTSEFLHLVRKDRIVKLQFKSFH